VLVFAECWNMVEQPAIFLKNQADLPLSAAMNGMIADNMGISFAGSLLYLIPVVLLFLLFQEKIIAGLKRLRW